jgi:hypothetical protein
MGRLIVRVGPSARITIDGELVARAASRAEVELDPARAHALRLSAPGFRAYGTSLQISPGTTVLRHFRLERESAPPPGDEPADDPNGAIDPYAAAR